jgi:hypothetical protein
MIRFAWTVGRKQKSKSERWMLKYSRVLKGELTNGEGNRDGGGNGGGGKMNKIETRTLMRCLLVDR